MRLADPDRGDRHQRQDIKARRDHQHGVAGRVDIGGEQLAETIEQAEHDDIERQHATASRVRDHGVHPALDHHSLSGIGKADDRLDGHDGRDSGRCRATGKGPPRTQRRRHRPALRRRADQSHRTNTAKQKTNTFGPDHQADGVRAIAVGDKPQGQQRVKNPDPTACSAPPASGEATDQGDMAGASSPSGPHQPDA